MFPLGSIFISTSYRMKMDGITLYDMWIRKKIEITLYMVYICLVFLQ